MNNKKILTYKDVEEFFPSDYSLSCCVYNRGQVYNPLEHIQSLKCDTDKIAAALTFIAPFVVGTATYVVTTQLLGQHHLLASAITGLAFNASNHMGEIFVSCYSKSPNTYGFPYAESPDYTKSPENRNSLIDNLKKLFENASKAVHNDRGGTYSVISNNEKGFDETLMKHVKDGALIDTEVLALYCQSRKFTDNKDLSITRAQALLAYKQFICKKHKSVNEFFSAEMPDPNYGDENSLDLTQVRNTWQEIGMKQEADKFLGYLISLSNEREFSSEEKSQARINDRIETNKRLGREYYSPNQKSSWPVANDLFGKRPDYIPYSEDLLQKGVNKFFKQSFEYSGFSKLPLCLRTSFLGFIFNPIRALTPTFNKNIPETIPARKSLCIPVEDLREALEPLLKNPSNLPTLAR
jgi:hypothetical protein